MIWEDGPKPDLSSLNAVMSLLGSAGAVLSGAVTCVQKVMLSEYWTY